MISEWILILKSLALNLPVLQTWNFIFPRTITVVAERGTGGLLVKALLNFPENLDNQERFKNSDFVFFHVRNLERLATCLEEIGKEQYLNIRGNRGLPLIITENSIIEDNGECFFIFSEERNFPDMPKAEDIVPHVSELRAINSKLKALSEKSISEEEKVLRAAVFFLEPYLYRSNSQISIEKFMSVAHNMCVQDEEVRDTHDIGEAFMKELTEWQRRTNFHDVYEMKLTDKLTNAEDDTMFYDEDFLYMPERLFKQIAVSLLEYLPVNQLKRGLSECGVIVKEGSDSATYTVKIRIKTGDGGYERLRMLRMKREKLRRFGTLDFVDICNIKKKEEK